MPEPTLSPQAQTSFAASQAYDTHRPTYTPSILQFLLERLELSGKHGARIVDLAAGTGKLTEALAAREEQFEITAVEPHEGMREVLVGKKLPRVRVVEGTGERMESVGDGSVDGVLVAQVGFSYLLFPTSFKHLFHPLCIKSSYCNANPPCLL